MEKWFLKNTKDLTLDYEKLNINKYICNILFNRDIDTEEKLEKFLNPNLEDLHTPLLLPDLIKAANILINSVATNKKIRIIGDYDVDGVMSTYILYKGLSYLKANVDYRIPNRVSDGYGINLRLIDEARTDGIDLIITCDNGIAARDEIQYAVENGIGVIVTDHHEVPVDTEKKELLPNALAIVDPKRESSKYPFREICGATVAYKLITYLYKINGIEDEKLYSDFLEFVAIATICDVMPLIDENRVLVFKGLEYLNKTKNSGIKAIINAADLSNNLISAYHIGFIIGPTINSSGRLESADIAVKLLLEEDYNVALKYATYLRELNSKRQKLTDDGFEKIDKIVNEFNLLEKFPVLILRDKEIDESVIGIIAGRIKEKYNRPAIILTTSKDELKGSGRSIEGFNLFEHVSASKELLSRFGGHAMACGLSLEEENFKKFVIDVNNKSNLTKEDLIKKVYIDTQINLSDVDISLATDIEKLNPFGNGNSKPLFATRELSIRKFNVFGKNKNVIKMVIGDSITQRDAILFENIDEFLDKISKYYNQDEIYKLKNNMTNNIKLDITYIPEINSFRGNDNIELKISHYRVSEGVK
ncbi:single-stranded-DNA-specific exonuclease RecJ [Peptoniphilus sp. oral taxon 386]|uniref:single-stranded-DNA-specific exonuclease RecJ n=1 Tax=Peptoniphilus sp. oral taxon 386 TaxID=652713 RepID=UPI0001DA9C85|nr:single-stranded-DNA-specific exonuclease RecJ [Peptoniphilus sp. oral taxon 386]EFI42247.1 single-stranded-DNA-specific exonuclease RecJ [Peptoniphilus sp. oral taxon 386 str. F0131]